MPPPKVVMQPKAKIAPPRHPVPEFMWCQRSDRVYVTIKVADCKNAMVNVTADDFLEFRGEGHGSAGDRQYALRVELEDCVVAQDSKWFVCGPSVRVRLQKTKVGPYWMGLTKGKKLVQCKVDWSSWLDEDEETENSTNPNGFEVNDYQMQMLGESNEFYRDLDHFTSSESEGEEENSVMIDQGMNDLDAIQKKFRELDVEKEIRAKSREERRMLRTDTRAAQFFVVQRERDIGYGREVREVTEREEELIAGAATLRARLKVQKKSEKAYWAVLPHHQMRPEAKWLVAAKEKAKEAAETALAEYTTEMGIDINVTPETKEEARKFIRKAALEAAFREVGYKDQAPVAAHEVAAAAARAALGEAAPAESCTAHEAACVAGAEACGMTVPIEVESKEREKRRALREIETIKKLEIDRAEYQRKENEKKAREEQRDFLLKGPRSDDEESDDDVPLEENVTEANKDVTDTEPSNKKAAAKKKQKEAMEQAEVDAKEAVDNPACDADDAFTLEEDEAVGGAGSDGEQEFDLQLEDNLTSDGVQL